MSPSWIPGFIPTKILSVSYTHLTSFQTLPDNAQIVFHSLFTGHLHFIKNMIIGTADQNTCFLNSHLPHKFKILFIRPYPGCDLRELISPFHTFVNRIPVLFTVKEKFALTDNALWTAQDVYKRQYPPRPAYLPMKQHLSLPRQRASPVEAAPAE